MSSKKWLNEFIYGKYRDASDEDDDMNDDEEIVDEDDANNSTYSDEDEVEEETSSSSSSLSQKSKDDGFEKIGSKPRRRRRQNRRRCETNTQDDCFVIAINPSQKYFLLFDDLRSLLNNNTTNMERSLGLDRAAQETFSAETERALMQSLANWLDKITEGLCPNKHAIREWPVFN